MVQKQGRPPKRAPYCCTENYFLAEAAGFAADAAGFMPEAPALGAPAWEAANETTANEAATIAIAIFFMS